MAFHENLRIQRLAKGQTQPALAEAAQIEQSYLSKLENGRSSPSDEVLARLAAALGTTAEELMRNGAETEAVPLDRRVLIGAALGIALVAGAAGWFGHGLMERRDAVPFVADGVNGSLAERLEFAAPPELQIELIQVDDDGSVTVTGRTKDRDAVTAFVAAARKVGVGEPTTMMLSDGDSRFHLRLAPGRAAAPAATP